MQHALIPLNMPWGTVRVINNMLADPRCTSDHILITADGLDAMIKELPPGSHFTAPLRENAALLRQWAPQYAARPLGRPHGDFDGTLSP